MSWLSDIAGKAENFLNAMDKSAASAINQAANVVQNVNPHSIIESPSSPNRKYSIKSDADVIDAEFIETPDIMSLKTSASTNSLHSFNGNGNVASVTKGHKRTSSYESVGSRSSKNNDDDRLMEFLNNKENKIPEEEWHNRLNDAEDFEIHSQKSHDSDHSTSSITKDYQSNNIKIEFQKTKELSNLQKRYSELVSENKQIQKKAIAYHNQSVQNEKALRELRSRESDFLASIETKNSQIDALKVQMEQFDSDLKQKQIQISQLEKMNLELENLVGNKSSMDCDLVSNLEAEIASLKQTLNEERNELKRIQESNREQFNRLEDNQRSLIDEIENCRRLVVEAKNAKAESEFITETLWKKLETLEIDYSEFRLKAKRALSDKEEMIKTLQCVTSEIPQSEFISHDSQSDRLRLLQEQCDSLVCEIANLQSKYEQSKLVADKCENETIPRFEFEIRTLKERLAQEESLSSTLKADVRQLTEESKQSQDDLNHVRTSLSTRIIERDEEIEKLRKQLVFKQQRGIVNVVVPTSSTASTTNSLLLNSAPAEEWEQRLKSLTENLIQKQATVEQLSSANHSLKLQLERSEQRFREMANSNTNLSNDVAIGIYHSPTFTNLIKHRMSGNQMLDGSMISLIEDSPDDDNVTRKVKRAYSAIDAFSIRTGNFLRVYPSARAALLVYVLVLHIWVAFILMFYEPEIHSTDLYSKKGL